MKTSEEDSRVLLYISIVKQLVRLILKGGLCRNCLDIQSSQSKQLLKHCQPRYKLKNPLPMKTESLVGATFVEDKTTTRQHCVGQYETDLFVPTFQKSKQFAIHVKNKVRLGNKGKNLLCSLLVVNLYFFLSNCFSMPWLLIYIYHFIPFTHVYSSV